MYSIVKGTFNRCLTVLFSEVLLLLLGSLLLNWLGSLYYEKIYKDFSLTNAGQLNPWRRIGWAVVPFCNPYKQGWNSRQKSL